MIFRNLEVTPVDPVPRWGFEGVLTALIAGSHVSFVVIGGRAELTPISTPLHTLKTILLVFTFDKAASRARKLFKIVPVFNDNDICRI